jgi:hypothetical protein
MILAREGEWELEANAAWKSEKDEDICFIVMSGRNEEIIYVSIISFDIRVSHLLRSSKRAIMSLLNEENLRIGNINLL